MVVERGTQRAVAAIFFALTAIVYLIAWLSPAIGLERDDAVYLVAAKALATGHGYTIESLPQPVPQTEYAPLFGVVLAPFTLISGDPRWLKLLPFGCAAAWLVLTHRLLLKMGASTAGALLLVGLTAASPAVVFLGTSLVPETLFALLVTAALLMLIEERALTAGIYAGLATLTETAGIALIAAAIVTLVARGRLRSAAIFAAAAMAISAPWFGWSLARQPREPTNIIIDLAANEKVMVLGSNLAALVRSPTSLLAGATNGFATLGTLIVLGWSLIRRRQFLPDLFIALYALTLVCRVSPPERLMAPVLPLVLWIAWRVFSRIRTQEAVAAAVLLALVFPLWADARRIQTTRRSGYFSVRGDAPDDWEQLGKLFRKLRESTPVESVVVANLDPLFYLETGRKAVRGFVANSFELFYGPRQSSITPDRIMEAIYRSQASYVVLTPDRGLPESAAFHDAVYALERGGVLEPVPIPAIASDYRLLRIAGSRD